MSRDKSLHQALLFSSARGEKREKDHDTSQARVQKQKHTIGWISRWSPTLVLVARFSAYVWQSVQSTQCSPTLGRAWRLLATSTIAVIRGLTPCAVAAGFRFQEHEYRASAQTYLRSVYATMKPTSLLQQVATLSLPGRYA